MKRVTGSDRHIDTEKNRSEYELKRAKESGREQRRNKTGMRETDEEKNGGKRLSRTKQRKTKTVERRRDERLQKRK